jgi:tRNA U38,U39,U40 pseudouridine synthase TruA
VHATTKDKSDDKNDLLQGTTACIWSVPEVTHKNFVWRFQCKSRERRYFQTNYWEWKFTLN